MTMLPALRTGTLAALGAAAALLAACGDDGLGVDLEDFEPIPSLLDLDYASIQPAQTWDYWEVRFSNGPEDRRILGSGGNVARTDLDPATVAVLDALAPPSGFGIGCLPGYCYKYVAATRNGSVETFLTREQLRDFVGPVDVLAEAVLVVDAHGFSRGEPGETGYRRTTDGWEFVVVQLIRDCVPITYDRILLRLLEDGTLIEVKRELWETLENACV